MYKNNSNISSPLEKRFSFLNDKFIENKKEWDILNNDDLSSCLSDDEEDDE